MKKTITDVSAYQLPVDEELTIKKCRYESDAPMSARNKKKRISIVTGIHGDELEGQLICFEIAQRIKQNPEMLNGIVDIYPAMNPLGIDSIERGIPHFDLDMNRVFPGSDDGSMIESIAYGVISSLKGSDLVIDLHASNIFLTEIPQARINETTYERLIPYAKLLNLDLLWVHPSATVLESTLCHSLNMAGTPCVVIEAGVGMRITKSYCRQITDGIFNAMHELGIWLGDDVFTAERHNPIISVGREVYFLNANASGIFIPSVKHSEVLKKDERIGQIVDPLSGDVLDDVLSPCDGILFTLRDYPVVYTGSLVARMIGGGFDE